MDIKCGIVLVKQQQHNAIKLRNQLEGLTNRWRRRRREEKESNATTSIARSKKRDMLELKKWERGGI